MNHIEIIKPHERIDPSLGGTGYLPPANPSSVADLVADLEKAKNVAPAFGWAVWKVRRESAKHPRRLTQPNGRYLTCAVIGGTRGWWFVSVNIADGLKALGCGV